MSDATVTFMWTVALLTLAVGIAAGFVIAYWLVLKDKRADQLQQDLERHEQEFHEYRDQVDEHFLRTSELFQDMTRQYRVLYEHLATGAQSLCSDRLVTNRMNVPESGPMVEHKPGGRAATEPAAAASPEPPPVQPAADAAGPNGAAAEGSGGPSPAATAGEKAPRAPDSGRERHTAQGETAEAGPAPEPKAGGAAEAPARAQAAGSLSEEEQEMESLAPRPPAAGVDMEPPAAGSTDAAADAAPGGVPKHRLH